MKKMPLQVRRRRHTSPQQRTALLAAFQRSGLSAAAFARQQGLRYTTFCNWRQRQGRSLPPAFVKVEVMEGARPVELLIEIGAQARVQLTSPAQSELAAGLLHQLTPGLMLNRQTAPKRSSRYHHPQRHCIEHIGVEALLPLAVVDQVGL